MNPLTPSKGHSKLGIASFIASVAFGLLFGTMFPAASILQAGQTESGGDFQGPEWIGWLIMLLFVLNLASLGLGTASICQRAKKTVFGILGLTFSAIAMFCGIGFFSFAGTKTDQPPMAVHSIASVAAQQPPPGTNHWQIRSGAR